MPYTPVPDGVNGSTAWNATAWNTYLRDNFADHEANKASVSYVDSKVDGSGWKPAVRLGTVAALPAYTASAGGTVLTANANGAIPSATTDTVSVSPGFGLLVKNEVTTPEHNGIYSVTQAGAAGVSPWILTRRSDADTGAELPPGSVVVVRAGATLADTAWIVSSPDTNPTIGTTPIVFTQFVGGGGGGGATTIDGLTDVDTTTAAPTTGQVLKWNGTNWVPDTDLQGGSVTGGNTVVATRVSDLAGITGRTEGDLVKLRGYYNAGDGGGGDLYFTASTAQAVNNGTVFALGQTGRLIRNMPFGANIHQAAWWGFYASDLVSDEANGSRCSLTAAATTGATSLTVNSIRDFRAGMGIGILLTNGNHHVTTVNTASGTTITLAVGLASGASNGARVDHCESPALERYLAGASSTHQNTLRMQEGQYVFCTGVATTDTLHEFVGIPKEYRKSTVQKRYPGTVFRFVHTGMTLWDGTARASVSVDGIAFYGINFQEDWGVTTNNSCGVVNLKLMNHWGFRRCTFHNLGVAIEYDSNQDQPNDALGIAGGDSSWNTVWDCGFYDTAQCIQQRRTGGIHVLGGWAMTSNLAGTSSWFLTTEGGSQVIVEAMKFDEIQGIDHHGYGGVFSNLRYERGPLAIRIRPNAALHDDNGDANKIIGCHIFAETGSVGIDIGTGCDRNFLSHNTFKGGGSEIVNNGTNTKGDTTWT